jgi:ubiquinone/menaquinone biosynthesis C-methylase UbiE
MGIQKMKCLDYSFELVAHLKKKYEVTFGNQIEFVCADARKMSAVFKEPCFDVVFDKGTLDCIMVASA